MTDKDIRALLHPKEHRYFVLSLVALIPVVLVLVALVLGTFGAILIFVASAVFTVWLVQRLVRAWYLAHNARIDEHSFPRLHAMIQDVKAQLGYDKPIEAFVVEEGSFNCLLMPFFGRKVLVLNSGLLSRDVPETEIRWVVARFVGSLRAKSYRLSIVQALISTTEKFLIFNIFLYPYERAVVMSGDRLGLELIGGDIRAAISAMNRLCVGPECSSQINLNGIARQEKDLKGFFGFLVRIMSSHPPLVHRYRELLGFARERYPHRIHELRSEFISTPPPQPQPRPQAGPYVHQSAA